jgi:hypothetical protein
MPQNVRNFWIELEVDGRKSKIATGPVSKDGTFSLDVSMRNVDGSIHKHVVSLSGYNQCDTKDSRKRYNAITFFIDGCAVTTVNNADPMEVTQH